MTRNDESETRVTQGAVTPGQIEMLCAPAAPSRPAGSELRAARDAHAARIPLARLPAPVFGWNTDDEPLATLLAAAGQRSAAPDGFHTNAISMLNNAAPISWPIASSHSIIAKGPQGYRTHKTTVNVH